MRNDHLLHRETLRVKVRIQFAVLAAGALLASGCGAPPMDYVLSEDTNQAMNPADQEKLAAALDAFFGTPTAPKLAEPLTRVLKAKSEDELAKGAVSYRRLCMHCHGLSGDGAGPTAKFVLPLPRDYRKGIFKFTSTDSQSGPTRDDLLHTLQTGIPGTSMPSFALFDQQEVENILDYVILLAIRGRTETGIKQAVDAGVGEIDAESVAAEAAVNANAWVSAQSKTIKPKAPRTEPDLASIRRGKELFLSDRAQCRKCHGDRALGDGLMNQPNVDPKDTTDTWGNQARPANLTLGVYRGGGRPIDLFRRIHSGIKGTPMPAQFTNLTKDEEIWDLVNFVMYLPYDDSVLSAKAQEEKKHGEGGL